MKQKSIPAVFMRGGTSKALMVHKRDLPADQDAWADIFTAAMGSPDPYGRQLDGMGGGVSSLSKVCIIGPSSHPDADVDYTFAQVSVKEKKVDYRGNCGNMSSAVGPFAVDQGLVKVTGDTACVRIFNTNTQKIIHNTFAVEDGQARYDGDLSIPGVGGTGSPIRLDFLSPGGASTGKLLPTGNLVDVLNVPGLGEIEVSMIDAANAAVFVRAQDVGMTGLELPDYLESHPDILARLDAIRVQASVAMGIAPDVESAKQIKIVPFVAIVSPVADNPTLSGEVVPATEIDLVARVISNGQPHRALPLTISLCTAVAARMTGSLPAQCLSSTVEAEGPLRLGMPSGVLTVGAQVEQNEGQWQAVAGSFYRTARRLFDGQVWFSGDALK
ncbi:2-methylaconitate cis-trans isomerase PrpF family protein [Alcaligenes endophyticus]|uniref:PrpF family protein n=1 Tax=Alcaligenes endophyticus TaxID=1929088 RepID=A0ABT8EIX7_9BURK|nr:PrpF domain-containing protein [Alcaligenes endophyticus]MCX5592567.1 PrpF family protein [Alcaligenes endophyticus]MDN4121085.1 PrpF family protein [Alcaligenes endophyticus]